MKGADEFEPLFPSDARYDRGKLSVFAGQHARGYTLTIYANGVEVFGMTAPDVNRVEGRLRSIRMFYKPNEHDWVDDFKHENGNYQNKCLKCNRLFIGHKRRFCCMVCAGYNKRKPLWKRAWAAVMEFIKKEGERK